MPAHRPVRTKAEDFHGGLLYLKFDCSPEVTAAPAHGTPPGQQGTLLHKGCKATIDPDAGTVSLPFRGTAGTLFQEDRSERQPA